MKAQSHHSFQPAGLALLLGIVLAWSAATAGGPPGQTADDPVSTASSPASFTTQEFLLFGPEASRLWSPQAGGSGIGGVRIDAEGDRHGGVGRKVKAGLLSLILPGAGQFYNGDRRKAMVFAGAEAAVWAAYFTFDLQGDSRSDTYREYAGIYAGTAGAHNDAYWQAVGRYMDSDAYNESVLREARALQEAPHNLIPAEQSWQWRTSDNLRTYQSLRADANRSYDRRDFMTLFAIVNRAVAVYDAVRSSVDDRLAARVLGFDVALEVSPSLHHPRTACTFSRGF